MKRFSSAYFSRYLLLSAAMTSFLVPGHAIAQTTQQVEYSSIAREDGYIRESGRVTASTKKNKRVQVRVGESALAIGDNGANQSFRSFVSFDTSNIPDTAIVTDAVLILTRGTTVGSNPFTKGFGPAQVDIKSGSFGSSASLEAQDFSEAATASHVGTFSGPSRNLGRVQVDLGAGALSAVNVRGRTQLRIYFDVPTNSDNRNTIMGYFAASASKSKYRPKLVITYVTNDSTGSNPTASPTPTPEATSTPTPTRIPNSTPESTRRPDATPTPVRPTATPTRVATATPTRVATATPTPQGPTSGIWKPAPGTSWQWQITGTIDTTLDVQMFDIDLFEAPQSVIDTLKSKGKIVICYFSAGSYENFRPDANQFPTSVLGSSNGWAGEKWLDIRQIATLAPIMRARLDLAKQKGCDGVEPDNVDGYTNSTGFPLTGAHQIAFNKWIAAEAHARGLSVGLKNDIDQVQALVNDFDWALNEQCFQYNECGALSPFVAAGKAVFGVEYSGSTSNFCPKAINLNFDWLKKNLDLDAPRVSCR